MYYYLIRSIKVVAIVVVLSLLGGDVAVYNQHTDHTQPQNGAVITLNLE